MALQVHRDGGYNYPLQAHEENKNESKNSHPLERQMNLLRQTKSGARKYNPMSSDVICAIVAIRRHLNSLARNFDAFNPYAPTIDNKEFKDLTDHFVSPTMDTRGDEEIFDLKKEIDTITLNKVELFSSDEQALARILLSHFCLFRGFTTKDKNSKSIQLTYQQQEIVFGILDELRARLYDTKSFRIFDKDFLRLITYLTIKLPSLESFTIKSNNREIPKPLVKSIVSLAGSKYILLSLMKTERVDGPKLLAKWIDTTKYPLLDLVDSMFKLEDIESVTPFIKYANLVSSEDSWYNRHSYSYSRDHNALALKCTSAETLIVDYSVSPETLCHFPNLVNLEIHSACTFPNFVYVNLKKFTCRFLKTIPPYNYVPNLEKLVLRMSMDRWDRPYKTIIPPKSLNYPTLRVLSVHNSDISSLSLIQLPELRILRLRNCKVNEILLPNLRELFCYGCEQLTLSNVFLDKLEVLHVHDTVISDWPCLLTNLRILNLAYSNTRDLPMSYSLSNLEELSILNCKYLKELPKGMINLKKLIISKNFALSDEQIKKILPPNVKIERI